MIPSSFDRKVNLLSHFFFLRWRRRRLIFVPSKRESRDSRAKLIFFCSLSLSLKQKTWKRQRLALSPLRLVNGWWSRSMLLAVARALRVILYGITLRLSTGPLSPSGRIRFVCCSESQKTYFFFIDYLLRIFLVAVIVFDSFMSSRSDVTNVKMMARKYLWLVDVTWLPLLYWWHQCVWDMVRRTFFLYVADVVVFLLLSRWVTTTAGSAERFTSSSLFLSIRQIYFHSSPYCLRTLRIQFRTSDLSAWSHLTPSFIKVDTMVTFFNFYDEMKSNDYA